jgi:hypothetical protein
MLNIGRGPRDQKCVVEALRSALARTDPKTLRQRRESDVRLAAMEP